LRARGTPTNILDSIVGSLAEEEVLDIGRWLRSPAREALRDAVTVRAYPASEALTTRKAMKVHPVALLNRVQARRLFERSALGEEALRQENPRRSVAQRRFDGHEGERL
jgi:hypothetical protein